MAGRRSTRSFRTIDECLTSMPTAKPTKNGRRPPFAYSAETLEVEQITALVGLKPTRFYAKGDPVSARSPQLRRTNAWLLKSGVAEDQGIDVHLGWLLDLVGSKVDALRTLRETCTRLDLFGRQSRYWQSMYFTTQSGWLIISTWLPFGPFVRLLPRPWLCIRGRWTTCVSFVKLWSAPERSPPCRVGVDLRWA